MHEMTALSDMQVQLQRLDKGPRDPRMSLIVAIAAAAAQDTGIHDESAPPAERLREAGIDNRGYIPLDRLDRLPLQAAQLRQ